MNRILEECVGRYPALSVCLPAMESALGVLLEAFRGGHRLLICGNGGSAADAGHIAGELMKSFLLPRALPAEMAGALGAMGEDGAYLLSHLEGGVPVISLCAHEALMTAIANDTAAQTIFAQQVTALGSAGDVLLAISTSGNSANCVYAAVAAKAKGMRVLSMTGAGGGRLAPLSDAAIMVPEAETYKVQEAHLPIYHALCAAVEAAFWGAQSY